MAMNKRVKRILKALSVDGIEVKSSRKLASLKTISPLKAFHRTLDAKIYNGDYEVPVRLYLPRNTDIFNLDILLFFHGGGWATESNDTYERACARLAAETEHIVVSVEYRLAPEYKFPTGLEDCYAVAKAMYTGELGQGINPEKITLIGDSAGGNITAAISLMARDRGEFEVKRQILIYPATYGDYNEATPFDSVHENGSDYILTLGKMRDYVELYINSEEDKKNKYFSILREEDFSNQPDTLVITAEFDPLRDEGEAYARELLKAGNRVQAYRIKDAIHGFFGLGIKSHSWNSCMELIREFLKEGKENV